MSRDPVRFAAAACALALASTCAASPAAPAGAAPASPSPASVSSAQLDALDFIELQIVYTTLLARYYVKIPPRTLVDGARTGIAADLLASGIGDATLPFTPARMSVGDGEDAIDAMVVRALARYKNRLDGHRLVQAAVAGELAALHDPYTLLFRPQAFKKFNAFLGNERFGGVGAIVSYDDATQTAEVDRVLPGGPADRAGLRRGDRFAAIDGRLVGAIGGQGLRDALRGKIGSTVRLEILRGGERLTFALVRAEVRDPEVTTARFDDVGYLRLSRFGDRAGAEVAAAIGDLKRDGAQALVLDLRGNGGGYGEEAVAVASAFVLGIVYTMTDRDGKPVVSYANDKLARWDDSPEHPLAVLVDGDTASAAEIVASAIQDGDAGTLFGARTFGKGVVQSVFPLPDGSAVKMTTARYATRAGHDIEGRGVSPDQIVLEPAGSRFGDPAADPQLARAVDALRTGMHAQPLGTPSPAASPSPVSSP